MQTRTHKSTKALTLPLLPAFSLHLPPPFSFFHFLLFCIILYILLLFLPSLSSSCVSFSSSSCFSPPPLLLFLPLPIPHLLYPHLHPPNSSATASLREHPSKLMQIVLRRSRGQKTRPLYRAFRKFDSLGLFYISLLFYWHAMYQ